MVDYLHRPVCHEAFFKKYASKKFLKGKVSRQLRSLRSVLILFPASIMTRQWAKKYHRLYIESALTEPYKSIKDSDE
jgi:G2/mitotic-specific cyclin 1/2